MSLALLCLCFSSFSELPDQTLQQSSHSLLEKNRKTKVGHGDLFFPHSSGRLRVAALQSDGAHGLSPDAATQKWVNGKVCLL